MSAMPHETRGRILSGMRWTLWLSGLAVPFGFCTSLILARTSPEAIGTYGLLAVYVSVVSTMLYVGGDAVLIKFMPVVPADRRVSFLFSYFFVITGFFIGWVALAGLWPKGLHYVFGDQSSRLSFRILLAAPIYIFFLMVVATLKGLLEIRWAQVMLRLVTIGTFLVYAALFFFTRETLVAHYGWLVWAIFLGLSTLVAVFGAWHLFHLSGWNWSIASLSFYLPAKFWRYMFATQQLSMVSFLASRLDFILIVNYGGLGTLGKYVAVSTVSSVIPVVNNLFVDTVLPSLTNLVAKENHEGASEVVAVYLRILFAVTAAVTCGLVLFSRLLTMMLGPKYHSLDIPVILMVLLFGLSAPGGAGGLLLSSVGKQQNAVWVGLAQMVTYVSLFLVMWPKFQLLGAILAYGTSELIFYVMLLYVAKRIVHIDFSFGREYLSFAVVALASAIVAAWLKPGFLLATLGWTAAFLSYLILSRYTVKECIALTHCFIPSRVSAVWNERKGQHGNR